MTDQRDIDLLRGDIEFTRRRIAGEIEAISERLTPENAKEVAKEKIVEAKDRAIENVKTSARKIADRASDVPGNIGHAVRENPIPTVMVCAGAGWLLYRAFTRKREEDFELIIDDPYAELEPIGEGAPGRMARARERVAHAASTARVRMGTAAGTARDRAHGAAVATKDRAAHLAHVGREKAVVARERTGDAYLGNPLLFGAGAIAVGFGIAMMLPKTDRESRILGEHRDRVLERAKSAALDAKDVAIGAAKEGMRAAKTSAKEATRKTLP